MKYRAKITIWLLLALTGLGGALSLQVDLAEDALDMLPGSALQGEMKLLQQLGMINRVFISLEAPPGSASPSVTPSGLLASAGALGEKLSASPLFTEVFYRLPEGYEFRLGAEVRKFLPVLTDANDLRLIEELIAPGPLRQKLQEDYLLLNSLAGLGLGSHIRQDPLGFTTVILEKLKSLRGGMRLQVRDGFFVSNDGINCLVWAESAVPLTSSAQAALVKAQIDAALQTSLAAGVTARIIGPLPHTLANAETIRNDLRRLLPAAALLLVTFLLLAIRDWRALLVVSIPFLAAPPAIAFLGAVHGTVSAMALGFGIVLLGIGVDFAVHIYLGCNPPQERPPIIPKDLARSLRMAFLTTVSVFAVLLLSRVPAHRQMALLAMAGLSWCLVLAWQVVPLLKRRDRVGAVSGPRPVLLANLLSAGGRARPLKLAVWAVFVAAGIAAWPALRYNGDLRALDVPSESVRSDEQNFIKTWGQEAEQVFVVAAASSQGAVLDLNDRVHQLLAAAGRLGGVQTLAPVLPGPARQGENLSGWQSFWAQRLAAFRPDLEKAAVETGFTGRAFQPMLDWISARPDLMRADDLLAGPLRPFVSSLFRQTTDEDGDLFLAATIIPDIPANAGVVERLGREITGVSVLSNSRWRHQVEKDLRNDLVRLSAIAALLVLMICAVFFRDYRTILAVLAPVISSLAAMGLSALLTGGELNIMHVLMGIMVIGLGVDYGIFIARACLDEVNSQAFMAVSICAVSTLIGFGVLSFAVHPALQALGTTVLVGIGAAWPTALILTPVLLQRKQRQAVAA